MCGSADKPARFKAKYIATLFSSLTRSSSFPLPDPRQLWRKRSLTLRYQGTSDQFFQ
jgi:hypothetical protein